MCVPLQMWSGQYSNMNNVSAVGFNLSDISSTWELVTECNVTNMSVGCDDNYANKTKELLETILRITEITFTCFDSVNVLGNAVLMLLIYKATTRMEVSGRLLINQAVADGGIGLSWLVLYGIMYANPHRDILQTSILVQRVIVVILHCESGLSLAMTLFALHIAICNPILYKVYNDPKTVTIFMVVSWLVAIGSWCLAFAADNFFILKRDSIIVLMNVSEQNAWFVWLPPFVGIILPLALVIVSYTRVCLHLRKSENISTASLSLTKMYVRQTKGILLVCISYMTTFIPLFVFGYFANLFQTDNDILFFLIGTILSYLNYVYLVIKLPLFLVAFASYRRVAYRLFCQRQATTAESSARGTMQHRKYKEDGCGFQRSSMKTRSPRKQVDETTKGIPGRDNHGFHSTCSLSQGDIAIISRANDNATDRPIAT